ALRETAIGGPVGAVAGARLVGLADEAGAVLDDVAADGDVLGRPRPVDGVDVAQHVGPVDGVDAVIVAGDGDDAGGQAGIDDCRLVPGDVAAARHGHGRGRCGSV